MAIDQLLRTKREEILRIAAKHVACNVQVLGSVACGEADDRSDIDLLVEMEPGRSLLDLRRLRISWSSCFGYWRNIGGDDQNPERGGVWSHHPLGADGFGFIWNQCYDEFSDWQRFENPLQGDRLYKNALCKGDILPYDFAKTLLQFQQRLWLKEIFCSPLKPLRP